LEISISPIFYENWSLFYLIKSILRS
jgi:hypothetical protein